MSKQTSLRFIPSIPDSREEPPEENAEFEKIKKERSSKGQMWEDAIYVKCLKAKWYSTTFYTLCGDKYRCGQTKGEV